MLKVGKTKLYYRSLTLIQNELRIPVFLIAFCTVAGTTKAQSCDDWLQLSASPSYAYSAEIDVASTKLTVEARFIRTTPYTGGQIFAGDLVSKHSDPNDVNYLLRPNGAEITTTSGYYKTADVCEIALNKIYHVAMVYDGITLKFYRNGYLLDEVPATGNLVQNNWRTFIGYYEPQVHPENFIGYIDEVRIWDYARPPELIRTYMNLSLPTPPAQVGLVAYYTFDDLANKQGNAAYNLTLSAAGAAIGIPSPDCSFIADSCGVAKIPPDSVVITNDVTICAGSHHQIKTHPADSYQWTPALYLDDPTSPVPVTTPPVTTTYYVEAYIASSNKTIRDSVTIIVVRTDIKASEDTTICAGSSVQMNVTQGTSFIWSPIVGLSDPQIPNPVASPAQTTKYIVTGIGESRCASSDTVIITVLPQPQVAVSDDTSICVSVPVQLQASGGTSYEWFPQQGLSNTTISNPVAVPESTTAYKVKITGNKGCSITDTVNIEVRKYPDFKTSGNTAVCEGDNVTLTASGGDAYTWTPSAGLSNPLAASTETVADRTKSYSVQILDNVCGHDTTITVAITANPIPVVTANKSNDINCASPNSLLTASGATSYFWEPFVFLDNATVAQTFVAVDTTTTFTVTGFSDAGCSSSATVTVKVDRGGTPRFVLPNAFSPNNDGKNDCFGIKRWGNSNIRQFSVYNRWGQMVFQTKDPGKCWDGTVNGTVQQPGIYIYVVDVTTFCGDIKTKGFVTLVR